MEWGIDVGGALAIIGNWGQFATFDQQRLEFHRPPPLDSAIKKGSFCRFQDLLNFFAVIAALYLHR